MQKAILFGPCIGELYWEVARFAMILPYYKQQKYKNQQIKYIVLTREERFDLYGKNANILVPLRISGDYSKYQPNCYRLDGFPISDYKSIASKFYTNYLKEYSIIEHIYPDISKKQFLNKNQFDQKKMIFDFKPRKENYRLVDEYLSNNSKPIVILAPRYRKGFARNWHKWPQFYDLLFQDKQLMNEYTFVLCGKPGEYIPDKKHRFYDMNDISLTSNSSKVGLLLVMLERSCFVCGSQSAIPNLGLLFKKEVLEFGHQKTLHTVTYNLFNTPVTFIENKNYDIDPLVFFKRFKKVISKKGAD